MFFIVKTFLVHKVELTLDLTDEEFSVMKLTFLTSSLTLIKHLENIGQTVRVQVCSVPFGFCQC